MFSDKLAKYDTKQLYDETTVFLIVVLLCFFLLVMPQYMMDSFMEIFRGLFVLTCMVLILVFTIITSSVLAVFSRKPINKDTKKNMALLVFVFITVINSLILYYYLKNLTSNLLILLPIINTGILVIQGIRLFLFGLSEQRIYEKQPKTYDIVISSIILCIIFSIGHFVLKTLWINTVSLCLLFILIRKDIYFWFSKQTIPEQKTIQYSDTKISPREPMPAGLFVFIIILICVSIYIFLQILLFFRPFFINNTYNYIFSDIIINIILIIIIILFLIISMGIPSGERIYWKIAVGLFSIIGVMQICFIILGILNLNIYLFSTNVGNLPIAMLLSLPLTCIVLIYLLRPRVKNYFFD